MTSLHPRHPSLAAVAAAVAALGLALGARAEAPSPITYAADVPMIEADGGLPCLQVQVADGSSALFAVDTGNTRAVVDTKVAKAAGLILVALPPPMPSDVYKTSLPALRIGALALPVDKALVADFAKNQLPADLGGTLGYTVFKDRAVQLDFIGHRIRISAPLTAPAMLPGRVDRWSAITFGKQGPPIVVARGFEVGGMPITAQVDTMFTGSTVIYDASIARLGFSGLAATKETEFFPLTDGGVKMLAVRVPSESFRGAALGGDNPKLYFPTPGVHQPDALFDATVVLELLKHSILTLDFHDMLISVSGSGGEPGWVGPASGSAAHAGPNAE